VSDTLRDRVAEALPEECTLIVVAHEGRQWWAAACEPESEHHVHTIGGEACWAYWPTLGLAAEGMGVVEHRLPRVCAWCKAGMGSVPVPEPPEVGEAKHSICGRCDRELAAKEEAEDRGEAVA